MAYSGSGRVTIASLTGGETLAQLTENDVQAYTLSEPSLITLQSAPAQISAWQKQGDELILQRQDGSVLRFQQFFSTDPQAQSQLIFQDGASLQQALFTTGTERAETTALTPTLAAVTTTQEAATVDSTLSLAATPVTAESAAVAEAAAPATYPTTPVLTIGSFTGDNIVSASEKLTPQTFSGTAQNLAEGTTLTVELNGKTYTTALAADGSWSVAIPAADLQTLPVGDNVVSVSFANSTGGTTTTNNTISVEASEAPPDAPLPQPTLDAPFGDGWLNQDEHDEAYTLTGKTGISGASQQIALTIDGVSYAGTVDEQGNWSVPLSLEAMREASFTDGEHSISVTVTDIWGRTGTTTGAFTVDTVAPALTIDSVSDDNVIDATEINEPLLISGTAEAGREITVTFGSESWTGTVDENGQWQFTVPADVLQTMPEGGYSVVASLSDEAGNSRTVSHAVQIYASDALPALAIDPISGDDAVSYKEGVYGVEITGTSAHLASGTLIELTLDGKSWTGYVNNNVWLVKIDDTDLATIKDGSYSVSVSATDGSGNTTSASRDLLLISHYNSSNPLVTTNELTLADVTYQNGEPIYTVTGTLETKFPLTQFAVKGDIESYRTGTLNADGSWSVQLNSQDIHTEQGLNTLVFGVQDGAGNWFEQLIYVSTDLITPVTPGGGGAEVPLPPVDNPTDGTTPGTDNPGSGTVPPETGGGAIATPKPSISTPFGDGWLNRQEKIDGDTLSGTTGVSGSGQKVTVNISGTNYLATVGDDGKWSLALTSDQLMGKEFTTGKHWINVYATNSEGETGKASAWFFTDVSTPHVAINAGRDEVINLRTTGANGTTLVGTGDAGDALTVTLGPLSWHVTVDSGGIWQVAVTPQQAQQLQAGDYTLTASISDTAKNVGTASLNVVVISGEDLPHVTIDSFSGDNRIDLTAISADLTISGTADAGDKLDITLSGNPPYTWHLTVDDSGKWSVTLNEADAQALDPGNYDINVVATDQYGVTNSATLDVNFYDAGVTPTLTIEPVTVDDIVQPDELNSGLNIYGLASGISAGTEVEIKIGDAIFHGTVTGGSWFATLDAEAVQAIADGKYELQVSAGNGSQTATAERDIILFTHYNSSDPTLTFNALNADDVVYHQGIAYYQLSGTITEGSLPITNLGLYGGELLNTYPLTVAADNTFQVEVRADDYARYDFEVTYRDVAGNWDRSWVSVVLPELPDAASANTATAAAADSVAADAAAVAAVADANTAADVANGTAVEPVAVAVPHPTIATPFGDGWLNWGERIGGQTLSGSTGITGSGQQVTVNISGTRYQAEVTTAGVWTLQLTEQQLEGKAFATGKHWINVTASNGEGETGQAQAFFFTDISTPQVTISELADRHIDINQLNEDVIFRGTGDEGNALTLTLGALTWHTAVDFDGNWQIALTPQQAQQLANGDYTLEVSISDTAKNVSSDSLALDFYRGDTLPAVAINNLSDDNRVNLNTITNDYPITGTGEAGDRVTLMLGSLSLGTVTVGANGEWKVWLSESDALQLNAGDTTLTATIQNTVGQTNSASLGVAFYAADVQPTLAMDTVEINDIVDYSVYRNDVQLHGDSYGLHTGTEVTVTLNNKSYIGYVNSDHWMATIPSQDIEAAADGFYSLSVSVESAGGSASASRDVLLLSHIYSSDPTLTFNALTPEDLIYHGDNAYYLVSGTINEPLPIDKLSFYGGEMLNYYAINVAADGTFTSEIPIDEYGSSSAPGFYVSYQDAAGHWYKSSDAVTLPVAPAAAETADQNAASVLVEDNPVEGVHATEESVAVAVATPESAAENSTIHGTGIDGAATVTGTAGDDTFTLSTLNLLNNLSGGAGHDTLVLSGSHEALDFAALGLKVSSVETLDLGTSGSNSITLGQKDLLALTDNASEALTIKGADGSSVTLSTAEGGVWSDVGQRTVDGQQFELYHNASASHEGSLADLLIQHNLQVQTA